MFAPVVGNAILVAVLASTNDNVDVEAKDVKIKVPNLSILGIEI